MIETDTTETNLEEINMIEVGVGAEAEVIATEGTEEIEVGPEVLQEAVVEGIENCVHVFSYT